MADEVRRDLPSFSASVLNKTEYLCQDDVGDGTTEAHAEVIDQDVSQCVRSHTIDLIQSPIDLRFTMRLFSLK